MGITGRIGRIIRSNLNDMLSRAEDPEKQLDLALADMQQALRDAKQVLVTQLAEEKRLQRELDAADQQAKTWKDRAQIALDAGKEDLAREALRKNHAYDDLATQLDGQLAEQQKAVDGLRAEYKLLEQRIAEAHSRRQEIGRELSRRARTPRADTSVRQVDSSLVTDRSAFDKFEEMADKVDQFESETAARAELDQYLHGEDELAARIDQLGAGSQARSDQRQREERDLSLDIELEEMKKRAGRATPPPAQAPPAAPEGEATEGEATEGRRSRRREVEAPADAEQPRPAPDQPVDKPGDDGDNGGDSGRRLEL